jgi:hypothetical protein
MRSYVGVRELTGSNDGVEVEKFLSSTGLGKGYAWCAAFVNYVYVTNGLETVKSAAWSPSWFTKNVIYQPSAHVLDAMPLPGDVFGIYFRSKSRVAHVGFVDRWPPGKFFETVEGNTNKAGSREGDGVYRKRRLKRQAYAVSRYIKED